MTTTAPPQTDPVAYQAWLEETLAEKEAAEFLGLLESWLRRARCVPGKGPPYKRLSSRLIIYVRRDLMDWRESCTRHSTLEYTAKGRLAQASLEALESPDEGGGGAE